MEEFEECIKQKCQELDEYEERIKEERRKKAKEDSEGAEGLLPHPIILRRDIFNRRGRSGDV